MTRLRIGLCNILLCSVAFVIAAPAQSVVFTKLHNFCDSGFHHCTDGDNPLAGLVQAADGNFYGTTLFGGANHNCPPYGGCGTVFKIAPSGALTSLYSFCSQPNCADGSEPWAGLVQASDGNLYGTTSAGGANNAGTVFRITPEGMLTTVYSFCAQSGCTDGDGPLAGLVQASDGNFYGTTSGGGDNFPGYGTVFKITPSGTLTTLHSFDGSDGDLPIAGLVQGRDGNFYGTTNWGGVNNGCGSGEGCGTVFKITPVGEFTALYSFCPQSGCTDGLIPSYDGLVQASDGNFYGTTRFGGTGPSCGGWPGCGTVFKILPEGTLTSVYSFHGLDGVLPSGGLVQASDGNFYGTTGGGGTYSAGTVFKVTSAGVLTTLYNLRSTDGIGPNGALVQASDGDFYGTAFNGGPSPNCNYDGTGCGTVFRLSVVHTCATCRP